MRERQFAGGAGMRARRGGLAILVAVAFAVAAGFRADAWPRDAAEPLAYHATLVNGNVVGSTFMIGEGLAVTNAHVVRGLRAGATVLLVPSTGDRGRFHGRLVAVSPRMDLALVEVPPGALAVNGLGDAAPRAGQTVVSAGVDATGGWPAPRLEVAGIVLQPSVSLPAFGPGLVARLPGARPGFSGGPLFDAEGRLAGHGHGDPLGSRRGASRLRLRAASGHGAGRDAGLRAARRRDPVGGRAADAGRGALIPPDVASAMA